MLTSSVVVGHLRQSSIAFGNVAIIGKCWKMTKNYIDLFQSQFVSFWKIIYRHSELFTVTRYRDKKLLSSYHHSDPLLTILMIKFHQNIVKRCGSTCAVSASEPKLSSFVSNVRVPTLYTFSSTTIRLPKLILASSSIFYDVTNLK